MFGTKQPIKDMFCCIKFNNYCAKHRHSVSMSSIYPWYRWNCHIIVTKIHENINATPVIKTIIVEFFRSTYEPETKFEKKLLIKILCSTISITHFKIQTGLHDSCQLNHGKQALLVGFFHLEIQNLNLRSHWLSDIDHRTSLDSILSLVVRPN